jgi:hypothetical protein
MSKLTGTHSEVSEIDFTTLTTVPGTVKVHGAPIQILDLRELPFLIPSSVSHPDIAGIIEGANDGRGRGRQGTSDASLHLTLLTYTHENSYCWYEHPPPPKYNPSPMISQSHARVISSSSYSTSSNLSATKRSLNLSLKGLALGSTNDHPLS